MNTSNKENNKEKDIEYRIMTKENLDEIKRIINNRFQQDNKNETLRMNILSDIEYHFTKHVNELKK